MYVKLIDKEQCLTTLNDSVNGVLANEAEWKKYNFTPQNGMVGEVVSTYTQGPFWVLYIVKFQEGIYVPVYSNGLDEISYSEYANVNHNNNGIDDFMRGAPAGGFFDALVPDLPNLRQSFRTDVANNMRKLTCDWTRNVYMPELEESCVMYAIDMALEYIKKSGISPIPQKILNQICEQVTDVYFDLFSKQFHEENKDRCIMEIKQLIQKSNTRSIVDDYYKNINERYARR